MKACGIQSPEMETAAKPSSQPRTKSCVVSGDGHCEAETGRFAGQNSRKRKDSPEIDRDRSSRPYPSRGKAEAQYASWRVCWGASGVHTVSMQPKDFMGTRESRQAQARLVGSDKLNKRGRSEGLTEVRLPDSTSRSGEPATWGSGQRKLNCSWET